MTTMFRRLPTLALCLALPSACAAQTAPMQVSLVVTEQCVVSHEAAEERRPPSVDCQFSSPYDVRPGADAATTTPSPRQGASLGEALWQVTF